MAHRLALLVVMVFITSLPVLADQTRRGLNVWFIDTEGGAATLIVTPAGESILIDCGNPGNRDAERIHQTATKLAGVSAIDHLIITHWHLDHYGGVARLARLMPIRKFYDRGIPESLAEDKANFPVLIKAYRAASGGKSTTLRPGDKVKLEQVAGGPPLELSCVCAAGEVLPESKSAKLNPIAGDHKPHPVDTSDNARSLGFVLTYGDWRFLDLGDLTWNVEHRLVAPTNKLGHVDVYQTTHHGLEISNNPVLVRTVEPCVAIFNNGPRKGCHPGVVATLRRIPGIEGIYQVHRNLKATDAENTTPYRIANDGRKKESGAGIRVTVAPDAKSYSVQVGDRGKTFTHRTRGAQP